MCGRYALGVRLSEGANVWLFRARHVDQKFARLAGRTASANGDNMLIQIVRPAGSTATALHDAAERLRNAPHRHLCAIREVVRHDAVESQFICLVAELPLARLADLTDPLDPAEAREAVSGLMSALAFLEAHRLLCDPPATGHVFQNSGGWRLLPMLSECGDSGSLGWNIAAFGAALSGMAALARLPDDLRVMLTDRSAVTPPSAAAIALACRGIRTLPPPVTEFNISTENGSRVLTWVPPAFGDVRVIAWEAGRPAICGRAMLVEDLDSLGPRLPLAAANRFAMPVQRGQVVHLVFATTLNSAAVLGKSVALSAVQDVAKLWVWVRGSELHARWRWPTGIDHAVAAVREDGFPESARDPRATLMEVRQSQYEHSGGWSMQISSQRRLFVTVYARDTIAGHATDSPGAADDCRVEIPVELCRTVRYRIAPLRQGWLRRRDGRYRLVIRSEKRDLPGLVLVGNSGRIPLDANDGVPLVTVRPRTLVSDGGAMSVPFDPRGLDDAWQARLFPTDAGSRRWVQCIFEGRDP
jgi:hypothetical protein